MKKCNFKYDAFEMHEGLKEDPEKYNGCALTMSFGNRRNECSGEENCILYQTYLISVPMHKVQPYQNKSDAELEIKRLSNEYPNMEYKIFPCSGGWLIEKRDKLEEKNESINNWK